MVFNFSDTKSILQHFLAQIRNKNVQKDAMRFRKNLYRIAQILAYEVSKSLNYKNEEIQTPLSKTNVNVINSQPVICSILRAGLIMHEGVLDFFDEADSAFVSAYRKHGSQEEIEVVIEYLASPILSNKTVILVDPMLATGKSIHLAYKALCKNGMPEKVVVINLIASKAGIDYVQKHIPNVAIYTAAIDLELDANSYIVPGLGDAGDLAYGEKINF